MKTIEDMMSFCSAAVLFDHEKEGIIEEFDLLRSCIIKNFRTRTPAKKVLVSLAIIDEIILKISDHDDDNIIGNINDLRQYILYMRSFMKLQNKVGKYSNTQIDEENYFVI